MLDSDSLRSWARLELDGYPTEETVPTYRIIEVGLFADLIHGRHHVKNQQLDIRKFPGEVVQYLTHVSLQFGIRKLIELSKTPNGAVSITRTTGGFEELLVYAIPQGASLIRGWQGASTAQFDQVLDTIRNRLLDLILELKRMNPDIENDDESISKLPHAASQAAVVQNIYGGNNVFASGREFTQHVHQHNGPHNLQTLFAELRTLNVSENDLRSLEVAIQEDGPRDQHTGFGERTRAWIGTAVANTAKGTVSVAKAAAPSLITECLKTYYGWK